MNCKVCGKTSAKNTSVSFFRFPKENVKCRNWAERCDLLALYEKHGTLRFYKSFRICSDHFDSRDIIFDGRKKRLLQSAVPQIASAVKTNKGEKEDDVKHFGWDEDFKLKLVKNLCRLCGRENRNLTDIYGIRGRVLNLENKLKYFPFVINKFDALPLSMCHECILKVNHFHDFIINCLKAESKLRILLDVEVCKKSFDSENRECHPWDPKTHKTPNSNPPSKLPDLPDILAHFPENLEVGFGSDKELRGSFLSKESGCFYKRTNRVMNHTDFISNVSSEHDYSNTILRDRLLSGQEIQTVDDLHDAFVDETAGRCDAYLGSFCSGEEFQMHSLTCSDGSEESRDFTCETCNKVFFSWLELEAHKSKHEIPLCRISDEKYQVLVFLKKRPLLQESENTCDSFPDLRSSETNSESDGKTSKSSGKTSPGNNKTESKPWGKLRLKSQKRRCHFCDKLFKNRQTCLTHERTHTGETPYQCKLCEKTFRSRPSLRQHRSVHSDKRAHNCHECGMSFKRKDTLSNHLRIHTGERPFVCKICGFAFKQRGDCTKHEKNHRKEETDGGLWSRTQNPALVGFSTDFPAVVPEITDEASWTDKRESTLTEENPSWNESFSILNSF